MKKKMAVILVVGILVALFFIKAFPYLNELKDKPVDGSVDMEKESRVERPVTVDISIESICMNMVTGQKYNKCDEENCDRTCELEGCKFFALNYDSSEMVNGSCHCNCYEGNRLKKALNPGST